jgi:hypothetical protein
MSFIALYLHQDIVKASRKSRFAITTMHSLVTFRVRVRNAIFSIVFLPLTARTEQKRMATIKFMVDVEEEDWID